MKFTSILYPTILLIGIVDSFSVVSVQVAGISKKKQPFAINSSFRSNPTKLSSAAAAVDESEKSISGGGTATIPNEILNLVKSIVGSGVLGLPAGKNR